MGRRLAAPLALVTLLVAAGCSAGADVERSPAEVPATSAEEPVTPVGRVEWQRVEAQGVAVRVPDDWVLLDRDGCEFQFTTWGPPDQDPCAADPEGVALYRSETFDPATLPGVLTRGDRRVGGYVDAGDEYAAYASTRQRALTEQVLASARPASEPFDATGTWTDRRGPRLAWRYPAHWDYIDSACASAQPRPGRFDSSVFDTRRIGGGCWLGRRNVEGTSSALVVKAPSEALAQLVLGSARPRR